ncbi:MAG: hypothetical protein ACYCZX_09805 [Rhodospirillaceae bacterium]
MIGRCAVLLLAASVIGGLSRAPAYGAAANTCAPSRNPITLNFVTKAEAPIYNNNLNVAGIRNLFATRGVNLAGVHRRALGITYVQSVLSLEASTLVKPQGRGFCVYLGSIDAEFGWDRMEVYVASEYKPGACEYRTILDHENQHVAIDKTTLRETAPQMRARLEAILREQKPLYVTNEQSGADQALAAIYSRMNGQLDQFRQNMNSRNAGIDTDSNYGALAQMCANWDAQNKPPPPKR